MAANHNSDLSIRGEELFLGLLSTNQVGGQRQLEQWVAFETDVLSAKATGTLCSSAAHSLSIIAANTRTFATSQIALEEYSDKMLTVLAEQIKDLAVNDPISELDNMHIC